MFGNVFSNIQGRFEDISKPRLFVILIALFAIIFLFLKFIAGLIFGDEAKINANIKKDIQYSAEQSQSVEFHNPDATIKLKGEFEDPVNIEGNEGVENDKIEQTQQINYNSNQPPINQKQSNKNIKDLLPEEVVLEQNEQINVSSNDKITKSNKESEKMPDPAVAKNNQIFDKVVKPKIQKKLKENAKKQAKKSSQSYDGVNVKSLNGKYKLQLLAYNDPMQAKSYAKKIKSSSIFKDKQFFISHKVVRSKDFYAVQIGIFNSKIYALDFCKKIKSQNKVKSCFLVAA